MSYTVDTLKDIHDERPDVELTFIVGADTARTLATWREPIRLLSLAELAVAGRDGLAEEEVREGLLALHPSPRVRFLAMDEVTVSSSSVRERLARGLPVTELVGERVAGYIAEHRLYGAATGRPAAGRSSPGGLSSTGGLSPTGGLSSTGGLSPTGGLSSDGGPR